jgi:seryl-tRNA synthetase
MLDIKLIQNDFENVAQSLRKKKVDESLLEELRALSLELKSARLVLEPLQAEQNAKSKLFGVYAKEGKDVAALKAELSLNKEKIAEATEIAAGRSGISQSTRADKIRTYNYPRNQVKDHRIDKSFNNLDSIMQGNLDDLLLELTILDQPIEENK